jgi:hypothetical protein
MMTDEWSFGPRTQGGSIDLRRIGGSIDLRRVGWLLIFITVSAVGIWLFWGLLNLANRVLAT